MSVGRVAYSDFEAKVVVPDFNLLTKEKIKPSHLIKCLQKHAGMLNTHEREDKSNGSLVHYLESLDRVHSALDGIEKTALGYINLITANKDSILFFKKLMEAILLAKLDFDLVTPLPLSDLKSELESKIPLINSLAMRDFFALLNRYLVLITTKDKVKFQSPTLALALMSSTVQNIIMAYQRDICSVLEARITDFEKSNLQHKDAISLKSVLFPEEKKISTTTHLLTTLGKEIEVKDVIPAVDELNQIKVLAWGKAASITQPHFDPKTLGIEGIALNILSTAPTEPGTKLEVLKDPTSSVLDRMRKVS